MLTRASCRNGIRVQVLPDPICRTVAEPMNAAPLASHVRYPIYRKDLIKVDREGVRRVVLAREWLSLDLGINRTLPGSDKYGMACSGMEDWRRTVENGPALDWALGLSLDGGSEFDLHLPRGRMFPEGLTHIENPAQSA